MKIAFISDIHGNLPALEAVMADIERHKPDDIFCLGDLINYAGWDNEVIDFIRNRNITSLQGNHDEGIGCNKGVFKFSYRTQEEHRFGLLSIKKVMETLTKENMDFLGNLPFMLQLQFKFPFHRLHIAMVHGSPSDNNEYVNHDAPDERLLELMDSVNADVLLMGHTHRSFHRTIFCEEENRKIYRHAINVGSVGKSKNGNNKACYTMLEINPHQDLAEPNCIRVHITEVEYDVEKVISHIRAIGLPKTYDDFLRTGKD